MKQIITLILCLAFVNGFSSTVYKHIHYTLNVDGNLSYNLDVNSDGTKDYVLQLTYNNQSGNMLCSIIGQTVGSNTNVSDENPEMAGDPVGANASWSSNLVLFASNGQGYDGGVFTEGEHYVGLSYTVNNNNYKAWLRITVSNYNTCVIEDLAYDNVSSNTINVGAGVTGIAPVSASNVDISFAGTNLLIFARDMGVVGSKLVVRDLSGREVLSSTLESSTQIIPLNNIASSAYLASIYFADGQVITRKVMKL